MFQWKAGTSAFAYAAFNISLAAAVLVPAAYEIGKEKIVRMGGILGGTILTLILMASHVTLVQLPHLMDYHIPMATMMEKLMSSFYLLYIIVIYGEIFTSVIGNLYGMERFINKTLQLKPLITGTAILIFAYFVSQIEYGVLLSILYPLFGYISLIFLFLLLIK